VLKPVHLWLRTVRGVATHLTLRDAQLCRKIEHVASRARQRGIGTGYAQAS
jgi:hypothetical protein